MPPMRRRTTTHFPDFDKDFDLSIDAIFEHLKEDDSEGDSKFVRAAQRIFEHRLLKEVISMPEFTSLKLELAEITAEDARAFLDEIKRLPCAEARVVEWSPELTHATSSNTAPYHLGAGKTALAALFYLVKYFKKEAGSLNKALSILIDARDHIDEYGSKGPDANSPQRFARHLLSRCINKSDQELSGTQSASVTLGYKSFRCSEKTGFVDNHCALQTARQIWDLCADATPCHGVDGSMTDEDEANDVELLSRADSKKIITDEGAESSDSEDDANSKTVKDRQQQLRMFDSDNDDDNDNIDPQSSSKVYTIPKINSTLKSVVAVSQSMNYQCRGKGLQALNYVEYCNMISIEKHKCKSVRDTATSGCTVQGDDHDDDAGDDADFKSGQNLNLDEKRASHKRKLDQDIDEFEQQPTAKESCGPGRKESKNFVFENNHPLFKNYVQKIRELFLVPIRAGGARPTFPKPLEVDTLPSNAWLNRHDEAVAFYSSNFVPWSDSKIPDLSPTNFRRWVFEQNVISKDQERETFATRLIARGRLQEFRNYAFLNQLNKADLKVNRQYRQRNRRMWTDDEIAEYFTLCGGDEGKKKAEDSIAALLKRQESRKTDVRRIENAERNEEWTTRLADDFNDLFGRIENTTRPSLTSLRSNLHRKHISPTSAEVHQASENLYKSTSPQNANDDAEVQVAAPSMASPPHEFNLDAANEDSEIPYIFDEIDQCKYPMELKRISNEEFVLAKNEWDILSKEDYKNNIPGTPRPPSNPEQRDLARCVLKKVRAAHALKSIRELHDSTADDVILSPDKNEKALKDSSEVGIMVVGAPGVGKSHTIKTISFFINHENLGIVISSAWTGVATIQVFMYN